METKGQPILASGKMFKFNSLIKLPVKCQKPYSAKGFFHKEMEIIGQAILANGKMLKLNYYYENNVTIQLPKRSLSKRLFSQKNGDNRPSNSRKWQNVKTNSLT